MSNLKNVKPVIVENIKSGEILEFQSQYALARYFSELYDIESSSKNIGRLVNQKNHTERLGEYVLRGINNARYNI